jgi:hypothetical protein
MSTVKARVRRCFSRRENVEHLSIFAVLCMIEMSLIMEFAYWVISIVVTLSIFARESSLIIFFAEEIEHEVREAVERTEEAVEGRQLVPVPVESEESD